MSAATCSPASSLTSVSTTFAPSDANSCDATIPMPLAPPVISATLLSSRPMPALLLLLASGPRPDAGEDSPFSRLERMPELPEEIKARPEAQARTRAHRVAHARGLYPAQVGARGTPDRRTRPDGGAPQGRSRARRHPRERRVRRGQGCAGADGVADPPLEGGATRSGDRSRLPSRPTASSRTCSSRFAWSMTTTRRDLPPGRARRGEGARRSHRDHVLSAGTGADGGVEGPAGPREGSRRKLRIHRGRVRTVHGLMSAS